jgi:hypothetical protein
MLREYQQRTIDQLYAWFEAGNTGNPCLWLKGLPKLTPTDIVSGRADRIHKMPPSPDRWKLRSATYQGIADAMAKQWDGRVVG